MEPTASEPTTAAGRPGRGLAIAGLVSFTRIYTGVHYPSDVLGGAALGAGLAALVWMAKRPLESRFAALRAPQQSQLEASVAPWRE